METVLREIGVGDLSIPKKVRGLAASSGALLQAYEEALAEGEAAVAAVIAEALPLEAGASGAVSQAPRALSNGDARACCGRKTLRRCARAT